METFGVHAQMTSKRQRLLDELGNRTAIGSTEGGGLFGSNDGDTVVEDDVMVPITFDEMTKVNHSDCWACHNVTPAAVRENKHIFNLVRLYTDNSTSICKDAIYSLVKEYYDTQIKPKTQNKVEWSLESIREHFMRHTRYPTDEIIRQIDMAEGIRTYLMDNLAQQNKTDGQIKFNHQNVKMLISINKELRILRNMKQEIPQMIGYDATLDY